MNLTKARVKDVRKRAVLTIMGLAILGLISGLSLYGPGKEKHMDSKENVMSGAEPTAVSRPVDVSRRESIETATFAMG
jgi:hypothetical protein